MALTSKGFPGFQRHGIEQADFTIGSSRRIRRLHFVLTFLLVTVLALPPRAHSQASPLNPGSPEGSGGTSSTESSSTTTSSTTSTFDLHPPSSSTTTMPIDYSAHCAHDL